MHKTTKFITTRAIASKKLLTVAVPHIVGLEIGLAGGAVIHLTGARRCRVQDSPEQLLEKISKVEAHEQC